MEATGKRERNNKSKRAYGVEKYMEKYFQEKETINLNKSIKKEENIRTLNSFKKKEWI